jgi:hypothetical protein
MQWNHKSGDSLRIMQLATGGVPKAVEIVVAFG